MNSPFQPRKLQVPGLMGDDALNQSLKEYANNLNAGQKAAPPPDSAVDMIPRIQQEYLSKPPAVPAPSMRGAATAALPGPLGLLASGIGDIASSDGPQQQQQAPVTPQQNAINVRSDMLASGAADLSEAAAGSPVLRGTPFGIIGQIGQAGTLNPEEQQAEADRRAQDFKRDMQATTDHMKMREQLRALSDDDAAALGIPVAPGGTQPADQAANVAQDQAHMVELAQRNAEAVAATKDPSKQPTQTWWLNALQSGVKGAVNSIGIGPARFFAGELPELVRDATGVGALTGWEGQRSNVRAWIDTVDATLNKMLPGDKARSKDFATQLSQGSGSMLGFMLGGYISSAYGLPAWAGSATLGAATQGDQQFQDAENFHANAVSKYMSLVLGAAIGLSEAVPIDRMFLRADRATGGLVRRMLAHTAAGSAEEFIQEFGQAVGQDVVARWLYDEKRKFDIKSYLSQGLVGGLTGGLAGAATTALHDSGVSTNPADTTPPEQRQSIAQQAIDALSGQLDQLPGMAEHEAEQLANQPLANIVQPVPAPAAAPQVVQGRGGSIPVNANGQFEAHHESSTALDVIDPSFRGTGPLRGGERARLFGPDAVDRSYFGVGNPDYVRPKDQPYKLDTDPYHGEGLGPFRHTVEVDPNTIYNWFEDPLNLKSKLDRTAPPSEQVTKLEKLVKDAGFKGIYYSESTLGQTALMFDKTTPTSVVDKRSGLKQLPAPDFVLGTDRNAVASATKGRRDYQAAVKIDGRVFTGQQHRDALAQAINALGPTVVDRVDADPEKYFGFAIPTLPDVSKVELQPEDTQPLPGLEKSTGPIKSVVQAARAYAQARGLPIRRQADYVKADPARGKRIADAYEKMKHAPNNPKVKAAYQAMIDETLAQYQFVKATGLKIEAIEPGMPDPYPQGPKQVLADLQKGHLWFFPTESGFGSLNDIKDNPLLAPTNEKIGDRTLLANDVFRIVHDFFGHGMEGAGFGARGEENAWQAHMRLYSPAALPAVTSETRGQNSWVNFGPHGEANRANQRDTVYADQKTGIMPAWTWQEGVADDGSEADLLANIHSPQRVESLMQEVPGLKKIAGYLTPDEQAKLSKANASKIVEIFTNLPDAEEMAAVAFSGRAKRGWYARSAKALVDIFGLNDAPRFAGLLAALSPQTSVESNAVNALKMWVNWDKAGRPTDEASIRKLLGKSVQGGQGEASVLPAWIPNTITALTEPDALNITLSGPKVDSFMKNLQGKVNEVTNDAWMANFANVDQTLFRKTGQSPGKGAGYIGMAAVVRKAAEIATEKTGQQWTPAEVQETVWSWAKTLYEKSTAAGENRTAEQIVEAGGMTAEEIGATPDFASLFVSGVYRNILKEGGFDVESVAAGSGRADAASNDRGNPFSAEGSGFAGRAFQQSLGSAARRLDLLRARRQGQDTSVTTDETFFPDVGQRQNQLDHLTPEDHQFLADNLLANVGSQGEDPAAQIERDIHEFDSGNMTAKELRQRIEARGWSLDSSGLRGRNKPIGVFDPNGDHHDLFGNVVRRAPVRTGPLPLFPERTDQSFDRWFGDSEVVDGRGKPLVVFHGTPNKDGFRWFDPSKKGVTSVLFSAIEQHRNGFFFAENEDFAKSFADQNGPRKPGKVMPVFLSIQNAFDAREFDRSARLRTEEIVNRIKEIDPEYNARFFEDRVGADNFWEVLDTDERGDVVMQAMRDLGYDGIRMIEPNHDTRDSETVWVAFDNTQIKSAEENTGAYNPANPDIHANVGSRSPMKGEQQRPQQGIPTPQQAQAQQAAEHSDASLAKIRAGFVKLMGLTVRQGRLTVKGGGADVFGQYDRKQAVVRSKNTNDLSTIVHEGGHDLYFAAGNELKQMIAANDKLLMKVADDLYGGDTNTMPKSTHIAEGFAEFFRVYTLNRAYAERKYQPLVDAFDAVLDKEAPQLKAGLQLVGQQYAAWLQLPSSQMLKNMIVPGKRDAKLNEALRELHEAGFGTWMHEYARNALRDSINRFAPLNDLVTQTLNVAQDNKGQALDLKRADDPRVLMRLATNSGSRAMMQATDGVMPYNSTTPTTPSLRDALLTYHGKRTDQNLFSIDEARKQDFAAYIVALRGIDEYRRLAQGKIKRPPVTATLGDLQVVVQEMEAKYGTAFTEAAKMVHEYGMGLWQKAYDAGLMTEESYLDGLDRQFYVPLQRDMSDKKASLGSSALTGKSSLVKRFKGSDRDIIDPMDVMMHKTYALEQVISRNEVFRTLGLLADKAGKAGALIERVPSKQLMGRQLSVEEVAKQLTKDDDITAADAQDLMEILQASIENDNVLTFFRSEPVQTKGENIIFGWENGRLAALQLADGSLGADVVNTLNAVGRENLPLFTGLISSATTLFRGGIVSWPDFLFANFIKDQFSAFIITDVGFKPFVSGLRGAWDELRQGNWGRQYNATMGAMGGMNVANLHKSRIDRDIGSLRRQGYIATAFSGEGARGFMAGLGRVIELTETGTRIGVYKAAYERALKDGLTPWEASIEASYTATDMMDFGLNGSRMLLARRTIPFLNAQLQGLYKMMRTLGADEVRQRKGLNFVLRAYFKSTKNLDLSRTEKQAINTGRKAWVKMASLALISAALHYLFRDDPDYQNASEYLRTTGWVIPLGNGRIFYIPKPYELAILANFTERALESSEGDAEAMHRFGRGIAMTFAPPLAPPLIKTGVELMANKDFFTDSEIVPSYMQALAPELQFNSYTSTLAKQLGHALNMSPLKIDHVMSSLGASAYRDLMTMYNMTDSNRGTTDITDAPVIRRFIRDANRGSSAQQDFWRVASMTTGTLRSAEVTYKAYLQAGNENAANDFLNSLGPDEKAYAILTTDFKADYKRLNPYYRARQMLTIISAMRREMVTDLGLENTETKTSDPIKLSAHEKTDLDQALHELGTREMRNTMVAMNAPGWAGKKMLNTETTVNLIRKIDPRVGEELQRRIDKAKVYDAATVNQYWPEVKNRLLVDRENTFLDDILSIAKANR